MFAEIACSNVKIQRHIQLLFVVASLTAYDYIQSIFFRFVKTGYGAKSSKLSGFNNKEIEF